MAKKTGGFTVADLLAAKNQSVVEFGAGNIAEALAQDNANFSAQVEAVLNELSETTNERQRPVGSSIGGDMQEVDELGRGPTQRDVPSYLVAFPLRKYQFNVGWTAQWEKNATPEDYAVRNSAAQGADLRRIRYELQKAIFTPTNYTFRDHLGPDNADLTVKAFINADSTAMQNGPNGEVFDGTTHTHYDANATLTAAAVQAQINDVLEHRNGAKLRIYINQVDAAAWIALTGFQPLIAPYLAPGTQANQVIDPRLIINQTDNRMLGYFGAAEVWTKPWGVANYSICADVSAPTKPLVRRVEKVDRGLHLPAQVDAHPLRVQFAEHFYGFGAWNRVGLHVLRFNNASYAAPTLTY